MICLRDRIGERSRIDDAVDQAVCHSQPPQELIVPGTVATLALQGDFITLNKREPQR